ncbi:MAG: alkaline phosphatase D family protein [Caulobacteraceae bacterium]|nr:alkaline phosphatase D family protein [Caulobacteraceae bacterium]
MATRRDFLRSSSAALGVFVAAGPAFRPAAFAAASDAGARRYPQDVASGDPTPDGVVLWTRAEPAAGETDIPLVLHVSKRRDFSTVVVEKRLKALAGADHTARVVVSGLDPATVYYYRFVDEAHAASPVGRTRTAPDTAANVEPRFALASCQNFQTGYYHAYRHLLEREQREGADARIDFVLFVGDFIYELIFPASMGVPTRPLAFPDKPWDESNKNFGRKIQLQYAETVEEYRYLYRGHLADPWLRAARRNWPFVCIFDDHEMADDYWQSMTVYQPPGVPTQRRKVAANQAYFEYIPAMLSDLPRENPARDFRFAQVEDAPFGAVDELNRSTEPNNLAAIGTINISRRLQWGRNLDIILTDSRSHRSEHPVPGEVGLKLSFHPRALLPRPLVEEMDAGRTANDGHPRETIETRGMSIPNVRRNAPVGTMYGPDQKAWVKAQLQASKALWKVCVNSVPQTPLSFDFHFEGKTVAPDEVVMTDSWEGYPRERREMLEFVRDSQVANYISLSGDHHMHFCGLLSPDRDDGGAGAVGAEFVCAGISSASFGDVLRAFLKAKAPGTDAEALVSGPPVAAGRAPLPWSGVTALYGWRESLRCATASGADHVERPAAASRRLRHIPYMDSDSYGVCVATATATDFKVDFVTFDQTQAYADYSKPVEPIYVAHFSVPAQAAGAPAKLLGPTFTGRAPFPYDVG